MIDWHVALTLFMAGALITAIAAYVVLDGFDLGIGILTLATRDSIERDQMIDAISPFWDGNETWLVFGAAILLAMFPLAFSIILPALYAPIIVMLLALIFRGVAFEFRFRREPRPRTWDMAFAVGSIVATFTQGVVLGAFLQGFPIEDGRFAGNPWQWLSTFSLLTGTALVVGYSLLGATFLFWRTGGELQRRAGRWARPLLYGVLAFVALVSLWSAINLPGIAARWFSFPLVLACAPVPVLTAFCAVQLMRKLEPGRRSAWPFVCTVGIFLLGFAGLAISLYPVIAPPSVTLFDAAASASAQRFLFPGIAVLVPLILFRTWVNYRTLAERDESVIPAAPGPARVNP